MKLPNIEKMVRMVQADVSRPAFRDTVASKTEYMVEDVTADSAAWPDTHCVVSPSNKTGTK